MNGLALCAGVDGIGLGLGIAVPSYRTVCAVEREASAAAILVARQEDGSLHPFPVWDCLSTFDGKPWRGVVDLIHAGIPCQPWSVAGKQLGVEDERWIWADVLRIIREVEPQFIFLEEVRGFIRGGLGLVIRDLADCGYVGQYDIFRASDVGAPHRRERVFVLAHANAGRRGINVCGGIFNGERETCGRDADGRDTQLAHPPLRGLGVRGEPSGGGGLADAGPAGEDVRTCEFCGYEFDAACGRYGCPNCEGEGLADTSQPRLQGTELSASCGDGTGRGAPGSVAELRGTLPLFPLFPPGPSDAAAWRDILAQWPLLAPAISEEEIVANFRDPLNGLARSLAGSRADALRAGGNGVVSLAGALAFVILARRAGLDFWGGGGRLMSTGVRRAPSQAAPSRQSASRSLDALNQAAATFNRR
jgi:DNA (cytosine-5)-methyltransferase 1